MFMSWNNELFFSANSILTAEKRRLDGELRGLQQELDNLIAQMKNSEEKARKAMGDAGKNKFPVSIVYI